MCRFEHYFRLFCNFSAKTWRILSETGIIRAKPPQMPGFRFWKSFLYFALAFRLFPCYSISAGRGGPRSYFLVAGLICPLPGFSRHPQGKRAFPSAQPYSGIVWRLRHLAKRPTPRSDQPHAAPQREPERSCTVDRGRCVLKTESDMGPRLLPPVKRTAPGSVKGIGAPVPISNRIFQDNAGVLPAAGVLRQLMPGGFSRPFYTSP